MAQIQNILRKTVFRLMGRSAPKGDDPLPDFASFDRILLTFVNWRLGNNILITPAVAALTEAYPQVNFEFLGGPACVPVLEGYPLARITVVKRWQVSDPIRQMLLVRRLRREHYPAVIHVHPSTATIGAYLAGQTRAPVRVGCLRPQGNLNFTATVPRPTTAHKVDRMNEDLGHLGLPTGQVRMLRLSEDERMAAEAQLSAVGAGDAAERVVLFLSGRGRKGKAWSLEFFGSVAEGLRERGLRPIVILGPEELRREKRIRAALGEGVYLKQLPLRRVAAIVARCRLAIAPDSGPMHLAIAARTHTIALFRTNTAHEWGPRAGQGAVVFDPAGNDDLAVLAAVDAELGAN